jgi:hypothetical protein
MHAHKHCERTDLHSQNACGLLHFANCSSIGADLAARLYSAFHLPF